MLVSVIMSNSLSGVLVSNEKSGILSFLINSSKSTHGANALSQYVSSRLLYKSYKILSPKCDMPISYTSGKQKQYLCFILDKSLTHIFISFPVYLHGFSTFFRILSILFLSKFLPPKITP